jgi:hypothetical protein
MQFFYYYFILTSLQLDYKNLRTLIHLQCILPLFNLSGIFIAEKDNGSTSIPELTRLMCDQS